MNKVRIIEKQKELYLSSKDNIIGKVIHQEDYNNRKFLVLDINTENKGSSKFDIYVCLIMQERITYYSQAIYLNKKDIKSYIVTLIPDRTAKFIEEKIFQISINNLKTKKNGKVSTKKNGK
jgi:hypothetical protein